ncbi:MAG: AAA family ATPase [bacterium]
MPGSIEIKNLRNIRKLRFNIPDRGVSLLTAGNGAGKTSLLACLRRIGHSSAFPIHFPVSLQSDKLDNHSNGTITYEVNGNSVEYAYRGERWTPRPRKYANLFEQFGYASVTYIGASAERITPRPEDFDTRHVRGAEEAIKKAANEIFETEKFKELRSINLSPGVGNDAFVLALGTSPQTYHSEKHFSLGELCVLKLLRLLHGVANNSMIIVDELEMALHPRAQLRLLRYLEKQAAEKSLTIVFSTHSVTLLKCVNRRQIIYLEKQDDGEITPIYGCYPTFALGNIASDEEALPDWLLYVEDQFARDVLRAFFEKFARDKFANPTEQPNVKIVPVGGFKEVVTFFTRNKSVMPNQVVQVAVLDEDVKSETVAEWTKNSNHAQLAKFQALGSNLKYLPFTPEVGIMDHVSKNRQTFEKALRSYFRDNLLRISTFADKYESSLSGKSKRDSAKNSLGELIAYIGDRTQTPSETVRDGLCGVFANLTWASYKKDFMPLFASML